ncbi:F-box protein PP2-B15 [Rhododendron vialii]|uniref:F-box protein PP2-B15 n=1 Tax=Rhododendron vialii TaxID=182163 RepID=UPI00266008C4|nr:F-box protein PP2-B15 [Rhododendron vialii]
MDDLLPQDCVARILSFTSPRDACRVSLVCTVVGAAAKTDEVWGKFLPSDYLEVLSRLVEYSSLVFKSKKELYLWLCNPNLIDNGNKMFWLDKSTSKRCCMLSARELSITWGNDHLYWSWKPFIQSRFAEVAELITTWWLEITARISTRMLSPKTTYSAHLILNLANRAYGLDALPSEVSIEVGNHQVMRGTILLRRPEDGRKQPLERIFMGEEERVPRERGDGWLEIELGEFFNDGINDREDVRMSVKEVKGVQLKGGLIVEGIELRPRKELKEE